MTPTNGRASVGRPRTYLHQLCSDTRCSLVDLPGAIVNRDGERERERERERESRKSIQSAQLDDYDDDDVKHDEKGDLVCGAIWEGAQVYTVRLYSRLYNIFFVNLITLLYVSHYFLVYI